LNCNGYFVMIPNGLRKALVPKIDRETLVKRHNVRVVTIYLEVSVMAPPNTVSSFTMVLEKIMPDPPRKH
jgi:hypothetical protein